MRRALFRHEVAAAQHCSTALVRRKFPPGALAAYVDAVVVWMSSNNLFKQDTWLDARDARCSGADVAAHTDVVVTTPGSVGL
jgi:hypothetical protein